MSTQPRVGRGTNQEAVRRHNLGTLLRHVHRSGERSRAELTRDMRLNRSTIAGLVGELEALGVLEHAPPSTVHPQAGRPSAGVRLAEDGPYVVAVDLGVDRTVVARVGLGGRIDHRAQAPLDWPGEAWQVGSVVAGLIRTVLSDAPPKATLAGIGVAVPGLVRRTDGLVRLAPNLEWRDVSFGSIVLAALGLDVPISLANDADLGALAEHERGAGVGVDDLIFVSGNVGVGSGIILGGERIEGVGGYAGEVGHLVTDPRGRLCHCGNRGCWETEVGGPAIAEAIGLPIEKVAQLAEALNGLAEYPPELRRIGTRVGSGLASVVNAFNPQLVVLGGYFRSLYQLVADEVDTGLADHALTAPGKSVRLVLPGLADDSVLLGAAEVALAPLFEDPVAGISAGLVDAGTGVRAN